jgi:hypothetical protein
MGGTYPGPKWRDRLAAQVSQNFRWFNPVVTEWTQDAQETEVAVRAEADVILYVITPYQEGFYSYFEMTEDAVRSEKPVVIAFIPSYDDKAFSESQWSSLMAGKRLLERHSAIVCTSMEELIDWFGKFNPASPESRLLDTQTLLRKARTIDKPVTTQSTVQDKQERVETPLTEQSVAKAEAGTSAADTPTPTPEQSDGNTSVDDTVAQTTGA